MTLSDWASIGNLVSGAAVLISLVYLGQQIRQSSKHSRAAMHSAQSEAISDFLMRVAADSELAEISMRGNAGDPGLDRLQAWRYLYARRGAMVIYEDHFFQYRDGMVDDARDTNAKAVISANFREPGFRAMWKVMRATHDREFVAYMDAIMEAAGTAAAPDLVDAWKAQAAEERVKADAP